MTGKYILLGIACALLCVQMGVYIHFKLRGKGKAYTISKCAGSAIFTLTAFGSMLFKKPDGYAILLMCAAVLSFIGDYFLAQPNGKHRLRVGAAAFGVAHCFLVAAFILLAGFHWQVIPVAVLAFLLEALGARIIKLNFRGAGRGAAAYIFAVTCMAAFAGALLFVDSVPKTAAWLTAAGGVLFLVSDIFWMLYGLDRDAPKPLFKAINVLTYFPAVMLIMSALWFR